MRKIAEKEIDKEGKRCAGFSFHKYLDVSKNIIRTESLVLRPNGPELSCGGV
jgi:predicted aldo/keto reductase-like oxidoreductase